MHWIGAEHPEWSDPHLRSLKWEFRIFAHPVNFVCMVGSLLQGSFSETSNASDAFSGKGAWVNALWDVLIVSEDYVPTSSPPKFPRSTYQACTCCGARYTLNPKPSQTSNPTPPMLRSAGWESSDMPGSVVFSWLLVLMQVCGSLHRSCCSILLSEAAG